MSNQTVFLSAKAVVGYCKALKCWSSCQEWKTKYGRPGAGHVNFDQTKVNNYVELRQNLNPWTLVRAMKSECYCSSKSLVERKSHKQAHHSQCMSAFHNISLLRIYQKWPNIFPCQAWIDTPSVQTIYVFAHSLVLNLFCFVDGNMFSSCSFLCLTGWTRTRLYHIYFHNRRSRCGIDM